MKTIFLLIIVFIIAFFAIKSLIKMLKGEGGCSCSSNKSGNCAFKDKCGKH